MLQGRGLPTLLSVYFAVVGTLVACAGIGLVVVVKASAGLSQQAQRDKTLLDHRIESAREIRQQLAKPVARPEPLTPITAKVARAFDSNVVATKQYKLKQEARDAFASSEWSSQAYLSVQYDRHAPQ